MSALHWSWQGISLAAGAGLLTLILAFALLAAYRRLRHRSVTRWLAVSLLNALAVMALAALLNPPAWQRTVDRVVVLMTEGAPDEPSPGEVYVTTEIDQPPDHASLLLHAGQLPLRQTALGRLGIQGHGLTPSELKAFPPDLAVDFSPPALEGIIEPEWPRTVTVGATGAVSGRFVSPSEAVVEVELLDPSGQSLDQKRLSPGERFRFEFQPRAAGPVEYRLKVFRSGVLVTEEPVALNVTHGRSIDLLILQSAPSFDARQLRRWAGDRGSRVRIRSRISRDHWVSQGMNTTPEAPESEPGPALLSRTDLLIVDGRTWADLSSARKQLIAEAVGQGLGLMILADQALIDMPESQEDALLAGFGLRSEPSGTTHAAPLLRGFSNELQLPLSALEIDNTRVLPLLRDSSGLLLEAWRNHGIGRVVVSRLRDRYRWASSGNEALFGAYWNQVLATVARPRQAPYLLPPEASGILRTGKRVRVCALGGEASLQIGMTGPSGRERQLPLEPSALGGPEVCGFFWPAEVGWHALTLMETESEEPLDDARLHVTRPDDWSTARWHVRQTETQNWFRPPVPERTDDTAKPGRERAAQPLEPLIPWGLFVLTAALLWIERRLDPEF